MTDIGFIVDVAQCFGCNRLRIPKPWTPATLDLLRSEGRLRLSEYLCAHDDCGALDIVGTKRPARNGRGVPPA